MIHYLAIGVSKHDFYHSTLVGLRDYDEAYKLRRKIQDERDYFVGIYTYEAVSIAIGNAFRSKGSKPYTYRDKSITAELEEKEHLKHLTDEEKQVHIDNLFAMLGQMQTRFEQNQSKPS